MVWTPRVTVAAVVERDGRFLLVRERVDGGLIYNQPAGHLESGESLVAAIEREMLEETAWRFRPESVVGIYRWRQPKEDLTWIRVCFTGSLLQHEPERPLDEGIVAAEWLARDEIVASGIAPRSPLVLRCIDDYVAGRRFPLDVLVDMPA